LRVVRARAVVLAAALSITALLAATASAHRDGAAASAGGSRPFVSCPRQFNGTRSFPALGISQIGVLRISCATAYHYIENFPDHLRPYRCTHRFAAGDSFKYVCADASKAFRFTGQGE
jgi:hypothetical protein